MVRKSILYILIMTLIKTILNLSEKCGESGSPILITILKIDNVRNVIFFTFTRHTRYITDLSMVLLPNIYKYMYIYSGSKWELVIIYRAQDAIGTE